MLKNDELFRHPEMLCNGHIREIANEIKKQYSGIFQLFSNSNQSMLSAFINYNEENTPYQKWLFLADQYKNLPNHQHEIAVEIQKLFFTAFDLDTNYFKRLAKTRCSVLSILLKKKISDHFNQTNHSFQLSQEVNAYLKIYHPKRLTNEIIHRIGYIYIEKHGEKPNFISKLFFNNHACAKKLIAFQSDNIEERWHFLAKIYGELPSNWDDIASQIRTLFINAYGLEKHEFSKMIMISNPKEISICLNQIINEFYKKFSFSLPSLNVFNPKTIAIEGLNAALKKSVDVLCRNM